MDSVTVNGKAYMKATKAADEVGYAPDYVGQLCRKGVLDAIVLGKTWYVAEEALRAHKESVPRTNAAVARRDIERQKDVLDRGNASSSPRLPATIEQRKRLLETDIRYTKDADDLLPMVSEKVALAASYREPVREEKEEIHKPAPEPVEEEPLVRGEDVEETSAVEDEYIEERTIAIRRVQEEHEESIPLLRRMPRAMVAEQPEEDEEDHTDYNETETAEIRVRKPRKTGISRSLVAAMCLLVLLFVSATIFLESTWSYASNGKKGVSFHTSYNLASVHSVMQAIRGGEFN